MPSNEWKLLKSTQNSHESIFSIFHRNSFKLVTKISIFPQNESNDDKMMEAHRTSHASVSGSQFPASTFPETFKDFFSMINEDEDQVELVSNILEDKVR